MSSLLKKHIHELFVLNQCNNCQRKQYLQKASSSLFNCIAEICLNILNGNIPLKEQEKKKILKYRHLMRRLIRHKNRSIVKKRSIIQKGGFLPVILPPLLNVASILITELLKN